MTTLVTGCGGFIGSTLTDSLLKTGSPVVGIDNFNNFYTPSIKRKNISSAIQQENFTLLHTDLLALDAETLKYHDIDRVVHLAAYPGVLPSFKSPELYNRHNVGVTLRLLECMRKTGITKAVFASSSSVYGNNPSVPFSEDACIEPISIYGTTKATLEGYCRSYANAYGMDITCLRFFTCYGPRQRPDLAIHKFTKLIRDKQPITMYGDGSTSRDYTYIDDIVSGIRLALNNVNGFDIMNLGNSCPISLLTMIKAIGEVVGESPIIHKQPIPSGDVIQTWANISKIESKLGWKPVTSFYDGLVKFLDWLDP